MTTRKLAGVGLLEKARFWHLKCEVCGENPGSIHLVRDFEVQDDYESGMRRPTPVASHVFCPVHNRLPIEYHTSNLWQLLAYGGGQDG